MNDYEKQDRTEKEDDFFGGEPPKQTFGVQKSSIFSSANDSVVPNGKKSTKKIAVAAALIVIMIVAAALCGYFIGVGSGINKDMPLLVEAYNYLKKYYYEDISWDEFQELAAQSMMGQVDKFTGMYAVTAVGEVKPRLGISFVSDIYNYHYISDIEPDSPGAVATALYRYDSKGVNRESVSDLKRPLRLGDEVRYAGTPTADFDLATGLITGDVTRVVNADIALLSQVLSSGDTARIYVYDETENCYYEYRITKALIRSKIAVYHSPSDIGSSDTGYIKLTEFGDTAVDDFYAAVQAFVSDPAKPNRLILDLRNNGGGGVDILGFVAQFLLKNPSEQQLPMMRYEYNEGNGKMKEKTFYTVKSAESVLTGQTLEAFSLYNVVKDFDVTVLCNEYSASSSEALIGAMQFYNNTKIIGNTTYGKGVAQTVIYLAQGRYELLITNGRYYIPTLEDGKTVWIKSIHEIGFTPEEENVITNRFPVPLAEDPHVMRAMELLHE